MNDSVLTGRALGAVAIVAAYILAVGALAVASAGAAGAKIATEMVVFDAGVADADYVVFGQLKSKRKKCQRNRAMTLRVKRSGAFATVDSGTSSARGGWMLLTKLAGADITGVEVKAKRKKLRNGDVCKGASVKYVAAS